MSHFLQPVVAQTYATPELQQREEQHITEKANRLGVSEKSNTKTAIQATAEKQKLPDLSNYLEVSAIEAVNVGKHFAKEERFEFEKEADSEFNLNTFYLNLEKGKFIKVNRETKIFTVYDVILTETGFGFDCETCNIPAFRIVERTSNRIVCTQPAQDEGVEFEFQFTFER
ncbi:MAG: hypothetical protein JKX84_01055 [Flavobacteriales bacterium]|nr:hypothetical protein [Flavobacteriales bacterium]